MSRALPPGPPKGRKRTDIERRVDATRETVAKFNGRAFSFRKQSDCARLVAFQMKALGRPLPISAAGTWTNAEGARAALNRLGVSNIAELLDRNLERKSFADIMVGDIVQMEAEPGVLEDMGAMSIWLDHGSAFGYHEDATGPVSMLLLEPPLAVWGVL